METRGAGLLWYVSSHPHPFLVWGMHLRVADVINLQEKRTCSLRVPSAHSSLCPGSSWGTCLSLETFLKHQGLIRRHLTAFLPPQVIHVITPTQPEMPLLQLAMAEELPFFFFFFYDNKGCVADIAFLALTLREGEPQEMVGDRWGMGKLRTAIQPHPGKCTNVKDFVSCSEGLLEPTCLCEPLWECGASTSHMGCGGLCSVMPSSPLAWPLPLSMSPLLFLVLRYL